MDIFDGGRQQRLSAAQLAQLSLSDRLSATTDKGPRAASPSQTLRPPAWPSFPPPVRVRPPSRLPCVLVTVPSGVLFLRSGAADGTEGGRRKGGWQLAVDEQLLPLCCAASVPRVASSSFCCRTIVPSKSNIDLLTHIIYVTRTLLVLITIL